MGRLDPNKVPESLVSLVALAETWGLADDTERARLVEGASLIELVDLVSRVDGIYDYELYGWLSGEESYSESPTPEYIAITNLTIAADHARLRLQRRRD